jgi:hypothetical protein
VRQLVKSAKHTAIALSLSVAVLGASCAQAVRPTKVHIETTQSDLEHDEIVSANGVADFYPDQSNPHEMVMHPNDGSVIRATCIDAKCSTLLVTSQTAGSNSKSISFELVQTDDPNILMVRDESGDRTLGYFANNRGTWKFLPDLAQAQAHEHKGDTLRTVGKVALGALLVSALVIVAVGAAEADARANTVTTRCTTFGMSTTCTSN